MELGLYGEADGLLGRALTIAPSPALLEMISFVAAKKGEHARAEQACLSALEMDPNHAPSILSLGWLFLTMGRQAEARELIGRLEKLELREDTAKSLEELKKRLEDLVYRTIECASCGLSWKVLRDPPPAHAIRLYAMPPDNLPAGACPDCGKTYCIGCAKKNLDSAGRFICPACKRSLKLINEGLKKMVYDWAAKDGLVKKGKKTETEKRRHYAAKNAAPAKTVSEAKNPENKKPVSGKSAPIAKVPVEPPAKRGPGRPRKIVEAPAALPVKRPRGRPRKTK